MKLTTIKSLVAAALCAVGLSSFAAEPEAVQLWEGGPYWAECNIGATKPEDYGILTSFNDAAQAVTDALGNGWRLPTKAEFEALLANCGKGTWTEQNGAKGRLFTGTGDYSSNSIFLPAAGYDYGDGRKWAEYYGRYWSSEEVDGTYAWYLNFYDCDAPLYNYYRSWGFSVRAVRDTPLVTGPTVKVDSVETGDPWSTITVNYTLDGTDAATDYKVVFDVTANGVTRGVTNAAAKLTDGPASKVIDTAALFGAANADPKAKVRVSLIAVKTQVDGVQLWEDGPYWAECNVGATKPEEYGYYFWWGDTVGYTWNGSTWVSVQDGSTISFVNASPENTLSGKDVSHCLDDGNLKSDYDAATAYLGAPWRMPTYEELAKLVDKNVCTAKWTENWNGTGTNGYVVTGKTAGYTDKSIFLPAAGGGGEASFSRPNLDGRYWSSSPNTYSYFEAFNLDFQYNSFCVYGNYKRYYGFTVRPVRGVAEVPSDEKEFALTAFRELPENPTAEDVRAAIEASGAKDKNRILALIGGASDPVAAYQEFNAWAQGVGTVAVANSDHAGDSFAFGVEELFEHEPEVQISDVAVTSGAPGAMAISVTVKDGDSPKRVASEKVAQMFEATTDVADWTKGRIEATVTDRTKDLATPVEFTVTPGDGTSEKAFLRIRK